MSVNQGVAIGQNLAVNQSIICPRIQTNDLYLRNAIHLMDISQISNTAGTIQGYANAYVGLTPVKIALYNI
jgi:hypothetical protein